MTSTKPYLIRAIREWAMDNGLTPQILVDSTAPGTQVPSRHVRDGQIVLNLHDRAIQLRELGNEFLAFAARFGGVAHEVRVPVEAVLAVYARENGQGIFFKQEGPEAPPPGPESGESGPDGKAAGRAKPRLRVVK